MCWNVCLYFCLKKGLDAGNMGEVRWKRSKKWDNNGCVMLQNTRCIDK